MKKVFVFKLCFVFILLIFLSVSYVISLNRQVKQNRILVMITSYKRPLLLSGQILRFMNQSYPHFTLSVSVKGTQKEWIEKTFMKEWLPFIEKQRLMVRFDNNRGQLHNLLDTVRDLPQAEYDYFCKVDDDDWYAPDYLEEVNNWLNKEENIAISSTRNMIVLENGVNATKMHETKSDWSGQTICVSYKIIKDLLEIEKNPRAYEGFYSADTINRLKDRNEDALIHQFARAIGGKAQERDTPKTDIIYGKQYPSITRRQCN